MSRRRVFTVDLALQAILEEEEDFLFGPSLDSEAESGSESDGGSGTSAVGSGAAGAADNELSDNDEHYLDREVDTRSCAEKYTGNPGQSDIEEEAAHGAQGGQGMHEARHVCGCSKECLKQFDPAVLELTSLNMDEMLKEEKDLIVLGLLESARHKQDVTVRGKKKKRKRHRFDYSFLGVEICVGAFRQVYGIGRKHFENLLKHLEENGPVPRVHGNKGRKPKHATSFPVVENLVKFLRNHSEVFGLPHPAPLHGRAGVRPIYLPASQTFKKVHQLYVSSCQQSGLRAVGYDSFRSIWHQCLPEVKFMTARTDICDKCDVLRRKLVSAGSEAEKMAASNAFTSHVHHAQREREFYLGKTKEAKAELNNLVDPLQPPPHRPCSTDLRKVHYTFDFAQNVSLPHTARQVGPIY